MYVFAKPKSLLLRASAVKATLDKFSEQGGGCHQALLRQQRPWTFILQRGHWDFDSLSLAHKGRKCSSVPSPQIIPASCELEKHVYFIFYLNLPWGGRKKKKNTAQKDNKTVPPPPHGVWWYHNYITEYFFNRLSPLAWSEACKPPEIHGLPSFPPRVL